jgi:hypothetical protein
MSKRDAAAIAGAAGLIEVVLLLGHQVDLVSVGVVQDHEPGHGGVDDRGVRDAEPVQVLGPGFQVGAGVDADLQFQALLGDGFGVVAERQPGVVAAGRGPPAPWTVPCSSGNSNIRVQPKTREYQSAVTTMSRTGSFAPRRPSIRGICSLVMGHRPPDVSREA